LNRFLALPYFFDSVEFYLDVYTYVLGTNEAAVVGSPVVPGYLYAGSF
jgi:hypothetical protein